MHFASCTVYQIIAMHLAILLPCFDETRESLNPNAISVCLPYLKEKLGQRHAEVKRAVDLYHESIGKNQNPQVASQMLSDTVYKVLHPSELQELKAIIACHKRGLISFADRHVIEYLNCNVQQQKKISESVKKFWSKVEQHIYEIDKLAPGDEISLARSVAINEGAILRTEITNIIDQQWITRLEKLSLAFDMNKIIQHEVAKLVQQAFWERDAVDRLRRNPPNLMHQFTSNLLLIADDSEFQKALQLTEAQKDEVILLVSECNEAMKDLQESYLHFLLECKRNPTEFYNNIASTKSAEYTKLFSKLLTNQQNIRLFQLRCQIFGTNYAFNEKSAPLIGITQSQQDNLFTFVGNLRQNNEDVFRKLREGPEGVFFVKQFTSRAIYETYFNDEQRVRWDKILGEKMSDETIKKLGHKFCQRIRPNY